MKIWGRSLDKKWLNDWFKIKAGVFLASDNGEVQSKPGAIPPLRTSSSSPPFFNFAALLKVKPTSNCSCQTVQETGGFKADEVPPVWWLNFNHQSWAGGVHYVHEVICILIPFIHLCGVFFFFLSPQIYSLLVHRVSKNSDQGCWCRTATFWSVKSFQLQQRWLFPATFSQYDSNTQEKQPPGLKRKDAFMLFCVLLFCSWQRVFSWCQHEVITTN